ncbi:MAG: DNA polymerase Y family protein [Bacteroidota bacterium]
MQKRFVAIWFRYLTTDWLTLRRPELKGLPQVFAKSDHGRKVITAVNALAEGHGISPGMPVADAKALITNLHVVDEKPGRDLKLLKGLGEWCIRYTPVVSIDHNDGLFLEVSGCTHLWGSEEDYLKEITTRLISKGYQVLAAMADTAGTAWAVSRFGKRNPIVEINAQAQALLTLPPSALRLEPDIVLRLHKLGLSQISNFIRMPRSVLRRRFGEGLLSRLAQALGQEEEVIVPLQLPVPYQERLSSLEGIRTAKGIEIAIKKLLEILCTRLQNEGVGLRTAILKCYRVDGKVIVVSIGTNSPSYHIGHLFKLFELKIAQIAPALGIELFVLEATKVEEVSPLQEALWAATLGLDNQAVTELLDRVAIKVGINSIHRYLPDEHHWPERSIRLAGSIAEKPVVPWRNDRPRPTILLAKPERIEVTAPIPDYPPMLFRHKGQLHHIKKADGPERIAQEWWLESGEHRDYYQVEDEKGQRYWLFRLGHYKDDKSNNWFLHGYFA